MSFLFVESESDYMVGDADYDSFPISISVWIEKVGNGEALGGIVQIREDVAPSVTGDIGIFYTGGTDQVIYRVRGSATVTLSNVAAMSTFGDGAKGGFSHLLGVSRSATDHEFYVNGASYATSSSDPSTMQSLTKLTVGRQLLLTSGTALYPHVRIAEMGIWSNDQSGNVAALYNCARPSEFSSGLVHYQNFEDAINSPGTGSDLTNNGATQDDAHPICGGGGSNCPAPEGCEVAQGTMMILIDEGRR